jgi:hypothetical protein
MDTDIDIEMDMVMDIVMDIGMDMWTTRISASYSQVNFENLKSSA